MTVEQRWCDGDYTIGVFFARKIDFGANLSLEETQERATEVGPVKNKEKKREREREKEREIEGKGGSEDRSFCTHVRCDIRTLS